MPGQRILVVEDERIVALDIQGKLTAMGYDVPPVATSADGAVRAAARLRPDLVLMDIQLEGDLDGVAAAERIRRELEIPIVYLTAYSDERTLERAKTAQPFGYLLKPFEERELYATIEVALYKHQAEIEKAALEESLHRSRKMEAMGQLTAGVAHHFNLMLQGIIGNLDLAAAQATDELRPFLDDAVYDADRAAHLVRQLTLFYRHEQGTHAHVDLHDLLRELVQMCRHIFPRTIEIIDEVPEQLPAVPGNRAQLRQALANLCANARDAIAASGAEENTIRVGAAVSPPPAAASDGWARGGPDSVRIEVSDSGVGMDRETQERMFEPFFTTKDTGSPAGLGLAVAYGIVRDHGGWIECDTEPGVGTTMSVYLSLERAGDAGPAVAVTEPSVLPPIADLRPCRGNESILVIADLDRLRRILDLMLERNGYGVHLGRDTGDGIDLFRHEHRHIDLVVISLSQPASAAAVDDLLSQLLRIDARARALVITARPEDAARWSRAKGVLIQPFNTYQLLRTVRGILDR